jgi:hypothetical protein
MACLRAEEEVHMLGEQLWVLVNGAVVRVWIED